MDYTNDIFNEEKENYLYHGTQSTFEIINSKILKSNHSNTGKGIYFGRTFTTSSKYGDNTMNSSNIKSSKNPIDSVLIMKKQEGLKFHENDHRGSYGLITKEYILDGEYDLIKNLTDIVFTRKIDIDNFFKKFDSLPDDMKEKLKNINIYQYDYNPLSIDNDKYIEIRKQFLDELTKNSKLYLNVPKILNVIYESIISHENIYEHIHGTKDDEIIKYLETLKENNT